MNPAHVLLLANRKSGQSEQQRIHACIEKLRAHGISIDERITDEPGEIPALIRACRDRCDLVVVGGGDGTVNTAAPALLETGLPFALLPLGTANDLVRTLRLPDDPVAACDVILSGRLHSIDLGKVNEHYFFNVAHIGLGEKVSRQLQDGEKKRWGALSYLRSLVRVVRRYRPFRATIVCDGRKMRLRSIQITVGNGRFYGGGIPVTAEARIDDQQLDLYSIRPLPLWQLAALAPWIRFGRHTRLDYVPALSGRKIEIRTSRPLRIDTDGEITTATPATFEVIPQALTVVVPEQYFESNG